MSSEMTDQGTQKIKSHCRDCAGDRWHRVVARETRRWDEEEAGVFGSDTWEILSCLGCDTVSFRHSHWFSEDTGADGDPIDHVSYFPPSLVRSTPDWVGNLMWLLPVDELWVSELIGEIYSAAGMQSYSLAAMGARAIIDHLITSTAGDKGGFEDKLKRLGASGALGPVQSQVISAAFDAGSAAAHRGYKPTETDLFTLLDIMENLLFEFRVKPAKEKAHAKAAAELKARTPARVRSTGKTRPTSP